MEASLHMEAFTIIPVKSGAFAPTPKGASMSQEYWGVTINPVVIMYLIKGRDKVILAPPAAMKNGPRTIIIL
jgi:hypothetical protein